MLQLLRYVTLQPLPTPKISFSLPLPSNSKYVSNTCELCCYLVCKVVPDRKIVLVLVLIQHNSDQVEISHTFCSDELIEVLFAIVMEWGLEGPKITSRRANIEQEKKWGLWIKGMNYLLYRYIVRGLGESVGENGKCIRHRKFNFIKSTTNWTRKDLQYCHSETHRHFLLPFSVSARLNREISLWLFIDYYYRS